MALVTAPQKSEFLAAVLEDFYLDNFPTGYRVVMADRWVFAAIEMHNRKVWQHKGTDPRPTQISLTLKPGNTLILEAVDCQSVAASKEIKITSLEKLTIEVVFNHFCDLVTEFELDFDL